MSGKQKFSFLQQGITELLCVDLPNKLPVPLKALDKNK